MGRKRSAELALVVSLLVVSALAVAVPSGAAPSTAAAPTAPSSRAASFPDVPEGHDFAAEVAWMVARSITQGYDDGRFRPIDGVTRQAMAAFLHRFAHPEVTEPPPCSEAAFVDVDASHAFCGEIAWLADAGVAAGYEDGTFRPTDVVSRQAMAAFLHRFAEGAGTPPACATGPFPDVDVGHRFCGAITWLADSGVGRGFADGTFRPVAPVSRQAAAAFLHRLDAHLTGAGPGRTPTGRIAAGTSHTCALGADGALACWGDDTFGKASPPDGTFTQVAVGDMHSCGLAVGGTVACWGNDTHGQSSPPGGAFTRIAVGGVTTCGLRTDGTAECWGRIPTHAATPGGPFTDLAVGRVHACGLRGTGGVVCWGDDSFGQSSPPDGRFTHVAAGDLHTCGLGPDGTAACWGDGTTGQTDAPEGAFTQLSVGGAFIEDDAHSCGLAVEGEVHCWGADAAGQSSPSDGPFVEVAAGDIHTCGLRPDHTVTCWGDDEEGQSSPPVPEP